jgi:hypothetical protein
MERGEEVSAELLARIRVVRAEIGEIGRLVRAIGTKAEARQLADLIETANEVEREVTKEAAE